MNYLLKTTFIVDQSNKHHVELASFLKEHFNHLFLFESETNENADQSDFFFVFDNSDNHDEQNTIYFNNLKEHRYYFDLNHHIFTDTKKLLELSQFLTNFYLEKRQFILDFFPLQARLFDQNGKLQYHNQKLDPFFQLNDDEDMESWSLKELKETQKAKHYLVPQQSFDQILVQSYFGFYDQSQLKQVLDLTYDIKPLIKMYLEETAQAIVGWSDVTSGPSISNDF